MDCVVGIEGGGSFTRGVLATAVGDVLAVALGPGCNQFSSALTEPTWEVVAQVAGVLADSAARFDCSIRSAGIGLPSEPTGSPDSLRQVLPDACPLRVVGDAETAYRAGTSSEDGTLLVAGTGAVAASVAANKIVRSADGHGWLVGDRGSAVWIGRRTVEAVLDSLDGRGPDTSMTDAVLDFFSISSDARSYEFSDAFTLARNAFTCAPARFGILSKIATKHCDQGDMVASEIVSHAALELERSVVAVVQRAELRRCPIVLCGTLIGPQSPVGALLRRRIEDLGFAEVIWVADGTAGAVSIAFNALGVGLNDKVLETIRVATSKQIADGA